MGIGVLVATISAFASLIAVAVSVKTAADQRRLARQLAEEEHKLLFEQVRTERDSDIIRWTSACVGILAEIESEVAISENSNNNSFDHAAIRRLGHKLSALIDQGRMYFPNQAPEKKGFDRPAAYQGYRQIILTVLVRAYDLAVKLDQDAGFEERKKTARSIVRLRRLFVSEAQLAINPRRYIALKDMNDLKAGLGLEEQELGDIEGI